MGQHIKEKPPHPSEHLLVIDKPIVREGNRFDPTPGPATNISVPRPPVIFSDWACI